MKLGIIVLARLSSSRLPCKALLEFGGKPLIQHVLDRISFQFDKDLIVLATSLKSSDDRLASFVEGLGYKVYRGSLENVAERFMNAAISNDFDIAVRVTGDSLFADPQIITDLVEFFFNNSYDIVSNRKIKSYPIGQTYEVVDISKYKRFYKLFSRADDFEHVTNFFYEFEDLLNVKIGHFKNPDGIFREISLAIDTKDDYQRITNLFKNNPNMANLTYKEIYKFYEEHF